MRKSVRLRKLDLIVAIDADDARERVRSGDRIDLGLQPLHSGRRYWRLRPPAERLAIGARRRLEPPCELCSHRHRGVVARAAGHELDRVVRALEQALRKPQALSL